MKNEKIKYEERGAKKKEEVVQRGNIKASLRGGPPAKSFTWNSSGLPRLTGRLTCSGGKRNIIIDESSSSSSSSTTTMNHGRN